MLNMKVDPTISMKTQGRATESPAGKPRFLLENVPHRAKIGNNRSCFPGSGDVRDVKNEGTSGDVYENK
jgi:hypothetical protein